MTKTVRHNARYAAHHGAPSVDARPLQPTNLRLASRSSRPQASSSRPPLRCASRAGRICSRSPEPAYRENFPIIDLKDDREYIVG
jgi:hypothetical protein